ncbi:FkbM family methyltransferase [Thetidibacter halocola]|uniref:FkbM family methyltransferase n=1 Tax=Thetidibacter halocola TaxID=2827239 RepID=A0A8J7WAI6_9RHOB|nr:FkbM family methyltransferase [Thetidibacter halocola]MBS0123965.1 FkbM family methyltransferase [Thetidibacter halocola]
MEQVAAHIDGRDFVFHLNHPGCPIQGRHKVGKFYERDDLDRVAQHVAPGAHVIDVGANVGNHALYFAALMGAARVICVEPNPKAIAALRANVQANGLGEVISLDALGVGLSDLAEDGYRIEPAGRNLGAARLVPGGGIALHRGDDLFGEDPVDLIKIDVEGMEMRVLRGFSETIARTRPSLFVEVDEENAEDFANWAAENAYRTVFSARHQKANVNHFLQAEEAQR